MTRSDIVRVKHHPSQPQQPRQAQHGSSSSSSSHAWETPDNSSTPAVFSSATIWRESQGSLFWNDQGRTETPTETLRGRFRYVFGAGLQQRKKKKRGVGRWRTFYEPFRPSIVRRLENNDDDDAADDDDYYNNNDDDANDNVANDDAAAANDDDANNDDYKKNDDLYSAADERCSEFLVSFLEGTTDAHDTCEGMMNAYTAAGTYSSCYGY